MKGRIICFDFGLKRTGIAWTDPMQIIATAVDCIDTKELKKWILDVAQKEKVYSFLVGYPTDFQRKPTDATRYVEKFVEKLKELFPEIPVVLWDETFTSKMALQTMITAGVKKSQRAGKRLTNTIAATILLQEYLNTLPKS